MTNATQTERQAHWQDILLRQTKSGLSTAAFCKSEAIAPQTFYWWRAKLRDAASPSPVVPAKPRTTPPFVELGALRDPQATFDIRLELPGGIVLTLAQSGR